MDLMEHIDTTALARLDPCEVAQSRWRQVKLFKGLFLSLLFALCALFLVALGGLVWLIFFRDDSPTVQTIFTSLTAIANGVIVGFLSKNVKYVVNQEKDAFGAVERACASAG